MKLRWSISCGAVALAGILIGAGCRHTESVPADVRAEAAAPARSARPMTETERSAANERVRRQAVEAKCDALYDQAMRLRSKERYAEAAGKLREAADLLEGLTK